MTILQLASQANRKIGRFRHGLLEYCFRMKALCYCDPLTCADVPTVLISVTATDWIALTDPLSVKGTVRENALPYSRPCGLENHDERRELTANVKELSPTICAPDAAVKVNVTYWRSRVVEFATNSTSKLFEVMLVIWTLPSSICGTNG